MAQQQAPPAAQAPIVVVVDEVQITSDATLVLAPGAQHVKDHTPCLSWTTVYDNAGAVTNYTLGQSDAKGAFLPRCRFSVDQQTGTLLDGNHVLNVLFQAGHPIRDLPSVPVLTWARSCSPRCRSKP